MSELYDRESDTDIDVTKRLKGVTRPGNDEVRRMGEQAMRTILPEDSLDAIDIKLHKKKTQANSITDQVTHDKYRLDTKETNMSEKTAQGNPAQPAGWAVDNPVNPAAHPGSADLIAIEQQKRQDTVLQAEQDNPAPMDLENPAQPAGYAVAPPTNAPIPGQQATASVVTARVYAAENAEGVEGSRVLLDSHGSRIAGKVIAESTDNFWVKWDDGDSSVEDKSNYELIITEG